MRSFLVLLFSWLVLGVALPSQATADTVFHYTSESGDYIGQGQERTLNAGSGYTISANVSNSGNVGFSINGATWYNLNFAAPSGLPLKVGDYPGAVRYPFQPANTPGLDFSGDGRGSNQLTGQFQVLEISYDASGKLTSFAANFVQHSENAAAASYGQIRFNSNVPYTSPGGVAQLAANHYSVSSTAGSLSVAVTRRDGSTGPLSVTYSTLDGTDLAGRDYTATTGTLTWANGDTANKIFTVPILNSGNPYQGDGNFFVNLSGAGTGAQTQAAVAVVNDNSSVTRVHFTSEAGDYIGQGQERTFSSANGYVLTFSRNYDGGVSCSFNNSAAAGNAYSEYWSLDLASATGTIFGLGDYQDAQRFPFQDPGHPGLDLSGAGRGSNTLTGNFQVLEAQFDANGNVQKFAANFEQHSEGGTPALYGQVRYNSTVPLPTFPGRLQFAASSYSVFENAGQAAITVNRTGGTQGALSIAYFTQDGTARAGTNYTATNGTLSWADGDAAPKTLVIPVRNDGVRTSDLSLTVNLNGSPLGSVTQTTLTIVNQDPLVSGNLQFSAAAYSAKDTDGQAVVTVRRVGGGSGVLTARYATADGTATAGINYTDVSGTLQWTDGDMTAKTFTIPLLGPVTRQASQTVLVNLSGTSVLSPTQVTLTITNTHFPPVGAAEWSTANYPASENDPGVTLLVNRVGGSYGPLSVSYTTADGTALAGRDYATIQGSLSWSDGDASPKSITLPLGSPHVGGGGKRVLTLALTGANLGTVTRSQVTITDDYVAPVPTVSVAASVPTVPEDSGGFGAFVLTRTGDLAQPLTVVYTIKGSAVNGQDYKTLKGSKIIKAGKNNVKLKVLPHDSGLSGGKATVKLTLVPQDGVYNVDADQRKATVKIVR